MRLIGDCHGKYNAYVNICKDAERKGIETLQLGDMGFSYDHFSQYDLNPNTHKFIGGNHENYNLIKGCPNNLGGYGVYKDFFFVRGAFSIDKMHRTIGVDWFEEEELSYKILEAAIEVYADIKPEIMISHTCPDSIKGRFVGGIPFDSRTEKALEVMLQIHRPTKWIFGHFHMDKVVVENGTHFECLSELSFLDI